MTIAASFCKRVIILPGNGCTPILSSNWYGWLSTELVTKYPTIEVVIRDMPDPYVARESALIPFVQNEMGADESTIVVGHSSGGKRHNDLLLLLFSVEEFAKTSVKRTQGDRKVVTV
jgi:hypothetical protein